MEKARLIRSTHTGSYEFDFKGERFPVLTEEAEKVLANPTKAFYGVEIDHKMRLLVEEEVIELLQEEFKKLELKYQEADTSERIKLEKEKKELVEMSHVFLS